MSIMRKNKINLTSISQTLDQLSDSGSLLTDGDVDTVKLLLLVVALVESLLVDDGVNSDSGLTKLVETKEYYISKREKIN